MSMNLDNKSNLARRFEEAHELHSQIEAPTSDKSASSTSKIRLNAEPHPAILPPPLDEFTVKSDDFLIHPDEEWMFSCADEFYFHIPTSYIVPSSKNVDIQNEGSLPNESYYEDDMQCAIIDDNKCDESDENKSTDEDNDVDIDFEEHLEFHSLSIPSTHPLKSECEDRFVTKYALQMDILASSNACCYGTALFDGHGGSSCAEYCLGHMFNNLACRYRQLIPQIQIKKEMANNEMQRRSSKRRRIGHSGEEDSLSVEMEALMKSCVQAFKMTNNNYENYAKRKKTKDGSTSLVVLFYGPDEDGCLQIISANSGDCRAVLCRDKKAVPLTVDHKPNTASERSRIEKAGGTIKQIDGTWRVIVSGHNKKLIEGLSVSRSIGDFSMKSPKYLVAHEPDMTVHTVDFERDMFLVLASDGLWDCLTNEEVVDVVLQNIKNGFEATATLLGQMVRSRHGMDDITITIIYFKWNQNIFPQITKNENIDQDSEPQHVEEKPLKETIEYDPFAIAISNEDESDCEAQCKSATTSDSAETITFSSIPLASDVIFDADSIRLNKHRMTNTARSDEEHEIDTNDDVFDMFA